MATFITPLTELDAVNVLLESIGESPINTLVGELIDDVSIAQQRLYETSRAVQTKGWEFNTEKNFPLLRSLDAGSLNEIHVPPNCVKVQVVDPAVDVVQRGTRLYDRKTWSYVFTKDVKAITMVVLLPFEDLPEYARHYITIRALRVFIAGSAPSEKLVGFSQQDELDALSTLMGADAVVGGASIFNSPGMVKARRRNRGGYS